MISNWIKIYSIDQLPKDGYPFIALWKGRISLAQFSEDEKRFYISFDPADYEYSMPLDVDNVLKISHISTIKHPESYPEDFVAIK